MACKGPLYFVQRRYEVSALIYPRKSRADNIAAALNSKLDDPMPFTAGLADGRRLSSEREDPSDALYLSNRYLHIPHRQPLHMATILSIDKGLRPSS